MRGSHLLSTLEGRYAICKLSPDAEPPAASAAGELFAVVRTAAELSVVCPEEAAPAEAECVSGWRCLAVRGPFDFDAVGVLHSLAAPLAEAGIPILAFSTFDTDLLLVGAERLAAAVRALEAAGHRIEGARAGEEAGER